MGTFLLTDPIIGQMVIPVALYHGPTEDLIPIPGRDFAFVPPEDGFTIEPRGVKARIETNDQEHRNQLINRMTRLFLRIRETDIRHQEIPGTRTLWVDGDLFQIGCLVRSKKEEIL